MRCKKITALIAMILTFWGSELLSQDSSAILRVTPIEGYIYPETIYPTIPTSPVSQREEQTLLDDSQDIRVLPSSNPQSEVHASINKSNSQNVIFSANTYWYIGENSLMGYYVTQDGGGSWFGADTLPNNGIGRADPTTAFDASGNAYLGALMMTGTTDHKPDGYGVQHSNDFGSTWSSSVRGAGPTAGIDKEMMAADNISTSPYSDNIYVAWTEFIDGDGHLDHAAVKMNRSTDGGQTFSPSITLRSSNDGTGGGQGTCVATGPNGEVYICWADYSSGSVPADGIGFSKSINGGIEFSSIVAFQYNGIRMGGSGQDPRFNYTRVNDFPSMAVDKSNSQYSGRIYIVYPDGGNLSNDQSVIKIRNSSDGGSTWTDAQTISIDGARQSWFPWVTVDDYTGEVYVIFYSLDQEYGFYTNTYLAYSIDGGAAWEKIQVSDVPHVTAPIPGFANGYAGDYIGICAYEGHIFPVWSDNRNGTWQLYTSPLVNHEAVLTNRLLTDQQNLGGELTLDDTETSGFEYPEIFSIDEQSLYVDLGIMYLASTTEPNLGVNNEYKHIEWDNPSEYKLEMNKIFVSGHSELTAWFTTQSSVSIQTELPVQIQLHDPWYAYQENGNWIQPDAFRPLSEQGDGNGNVQVFVNQNSDFDPAIPIYRLKAPASYATADAIYAFDHWQSPSATQAVFNAQGATSTTNRQTKVVFKEAGATVTAHYTNALLGIGLSVTVPQGETLTIPAGAAYTIPDVQDYSGFYLDVAGTLQCNGTEENPIIIRTLDPNDQWFGIVLGQATAELTMSHTTIENALSFSYPYSASICVNEGNVAISNSTIKSKTGGIYIDSSPNIVLDHNAIIYTGTQPGSSVGVLFDRDSYTGNNAFSIINNTISNFNTGVETQTTIGGTGVTYAMRNNILYFNPAIGTGTIGFNQSLSGPDYWLHVNVDYNLVYGFQNTGYNTVSQAYKQNVIENEDPLLLPDLTFNTISSPAYNSGDPSTPYDPDLTLPDMGAYYFDPIPGAPTNFSISGGIGQHPQLNWTLPADQDLQSIDIYRKFTDQGGGYVLYQSVLPTVTNFTDIQVTIAAAGGKFTPNVCYRLQAKDNIDQLSNFSNGICKPYVSNKSLVLDDQVVPETFALYNAFPNPFNPTTTIMYDIPEFSNVQIVIYNTLGQVVASPVFGETQPGYRKFDWNGKDMMGNRMASGVYLYTMTASSLESENVFSDKKKMILLK